MILSNVVTSASKYKLPISKQCWEGTSAFESKPVKPSGQIFQAMATTLQEAFEENVRPFIDIIDELRSLGLDKDVALPAVVVVGDQSAGKSSVLEAISGVELPRGTNIVTRCPLELRLKRLRKNKAKELLGEGETSSMQPEWKGAISYTIHDTNEEIRETVHDPSKVGTAVEAATQKLTKGAKEISDNLIRLEVQSHEVPDLTLIDLPGIARVAVEGQSADVPEQIKVLIKKYVKKDETIILAVIPCNVDIATTEALQLAQEVDVNGERTLGVLTKPDLVDKGTEHDICQVVNGEKVKLKLGYTVVKCRGQKAIENKLSLEDATKEEENFFKNNEVLSTLYHEQKTCIKNLSNQLTKQLVEQIKRHMPGLKADINAKLSMVKKELERYGDCLPDDENERHNYLINLSMKLGELFKRLAKAEHIEEEKISNLRMYAEIKQKFHTLAADIRLLQPKRSTPRLETEVSKEIKKRKGKELPSFLSYAVFEEIARKEVKKIQQPASNCLKEVNAIVEKVASTVIEHYLVRFEPLMMEVTRLMNGERKKAEEETKDALKTIFAMENLIFTQDGNFTRHMQVIENEEQEKEKHIKGKTVVLPGVLRNVSEWFKEGEKMDAKHMVRCLESYCEVACTRMIDTIPMAIYYNLVKRLMDKMATELMKMSAKPETSMNLLKEDPEIVFTRKKLFEKQERLEMANVKLMKFAISDSSNSGVQFEDNSDDDL